jgi:NAD-dependent deacetylase
MEERLFSETFLSLVRRCKAVVVSTGAGTSAESGAPTFRTGDDALWSRVDPREYATPEAFERDPKRVWRWYDARRRKYHGLVPNPGHLALVELESMVPEFSLFTQNIDGLHQKAGSKRVFELHGNIWIGRCTAEGTLVDLPITPLPEIPPVCRCGAILRPNVVWFGEPLPAAVIEAALHAAANCEVFLVVGSSSTVQPAASLAWIAKENGAIVAEVNPETTELTGIADESFRGTSGVILPLLIEELRNHAR